MLCAILGIVAGYQIKRSGQIVYEAQAVLYVAPPTTPLGTQTFYDADRYIQSQVEVIKGRSIAERVASQLPGETTDSVDRSIRVEQRLKSDIVDVFAVSASPERSQLMANTYVDLYIKDLNDTVTKQQAPGLKAIDDRINSLVDQIGKLNQDIYVKVLPNSQIVPIEVQPQVAKRDQLGKEEDKLIEQKFQLEATQSQKVTTEVRQHAALPTFPKTSSKRLMLAGLLGGPMLGLGLALLSARLSSRVVDTAQVEEMLGQPIAARLRRIRGLGGNRSDVIRSLPVAAEGAIDLLCVRAEANASPTSALRIAVIGTERGAGSTTLAVAVAGRFARKGSTVVLVDADQNDPEVSEAFRTTTDAGLPALLARVDRISEVKLTGVDRRPRSATHAGNRAVFTPVTPDVRILGQGPKVGQPVLRRSNVPALLERLDNEAQVIVFDAGPLLDAATTVQIAAAVDAIILAVPFRRQRVSSLEAVARQLQTREGELLPVVTSPAKRRRRVTSGASSSVVVDGVDEATGAPDVAAPAPRPSGGRRPAIAGARTGNGRGITDEVSETEAIRVDD